MLSLHKICLIAAGVSVSGVLFSCASVSSVPVEESSAQSKESGEVFKYRDALGKKHKTALNPNAPRNDYIKKCFVLEDKDDGKDGQTNGKMAYIGDSRYASRLGCDISRHDGNVDWEAMREWGIEFVILRIGYRTYQGGIVKTDENFHKNYDDARAAGLDVGVYFFSQAITKDEAIEEAERVIDELQGKELQLPVVFDPENIPWEEARTDGVSGEVFTMTARTFCERVKQAGYEPMIYSNMIWQADMFDMAEIAKWLMWYADYEELPQTPYAFMMWQYTAFGAVPGCTKQKTDLDIMLTASPQ